VVTLVPVCPEVELGLGTPREPIQLQRAGRALRLVAPGSGADHTDAMRRCSEARVSELERLDLSGYVLKKDSPSCGMERVPVWEGRESARTGRGAFAAVLMARLPLLPVVEESGLRAAEARQGFLERVFAYRRLRALLDARWTPADLARFLEAEKQLALFRLPAACRKLERLAERAETLPRDELALRYAEVFMGALT
jgi:uncharacterized protein YbbK (DUF523 family)